MIQGRNFAVLYNEDAERKHTDNSDILVLSYIDSNIAENAPTHAATHACN